MTPTETEIAKRFVACPSWRWVAGTLLSLPRGSMMNKATTGRVTNAGEWGLPARGIPVGSLPIVTDRATQGAIFGLVLDKLGVRFCGLDDRGTFWEVRTLTGLPKHPRNVSYEGPTMVEALLAVLEAP